MSPGVAHRKNALLAHMGLGKAGVRKGSVAVPLLALILAALGFALYGLENGNAVLKGGFVERCKAAKGSGDIAKEDLRQACIDGLVSPEIVAAGFDVLSVKDKSNALLSFSSKDETSASKVPGAVTSTWREIMGLGNAFLREFVADFGKIIASSAQIVGLAAACSLLPGIAGLIYRRNFIGWFLIPFVLTLLLTASGWLPLPAGLTKMPESGSTFVFFVGQLVLLVLAYRLRRYSNEFRAFGAGVIPAYIHNGAVFAVLVGVGVSCVLDQPAGLWASIGIDGVFYKGEFMALGLPLLYSLLRRSTLVVDPNVNKNIVVCLDGTSNTPDQVERGLAAQTNVYKLFSMLKPADASGIVDYGTFDASITKRYAEKQFAFYYTGVGNKFETSAIGQIVGGATGMGASDIVERAYLDVMRIYKPGDRIFIFGFSRGAAIARLLANAIHARGAPRTVWTLRLLGRHWLLWKSRHKRPEDSQVRVAVLGCWDTVGAFGIAKKIAGLDLQKIDFFKDLSIPDNVDRAYHMVALDEQRFEFSPTLMEPDALEPERVVEVWFAGDHANIGGGWGTPKLSDVTLDFLLRHVSSGYACRPGKVPGAEDWGLHLSAYDMRAVTPDSTWQGATVALDPDPLGQVRQWYSALYNYEPRKLPLHAVISEAVFKRMVEATPVYAPQSLFSLNEALETKRTTVAREFDRMSRTGSLTAAESSAVLDFKDKLRLMRWPQYVAALDRDRITAGLAEVEHPGRRLVNVDGAIVPPTLASTSPRPEAVQLDRPVAHVDHEAPASRMVPSSQPGAPTQVLASAAQPRVTASPLT